MKTFIFICFLCICFFSGTAQIPLATTYTTGFGSTDISSWTDNSTFLGWYSTDASIVHQNVTAAAPSNTGSFYSYECSGDDDQKIGSRSSGGTGTLYYGVRLQNTSGNTISYLNIMYDWYQFSLAENGSAVNTIAFSYQVGASVTSLTSGSWTNFSALDFTAPNSTAACCSNQISGYPCAVGGSLSACLNVTIAPNEEIMFRWTDLNDANNDHHMGIDDFFVGIATDNTCSFILPITLTSFSAVPENNLNIINWATESELNFSHFVLEYSIDGYQFFELDNIQASSSASQGAVYRYSHDAAGKPIVYYRLRMVDLDGKYSYSNLISVRRDEPRVIQENGLVHVYFGDDFQDDYTVQIFSLQGELISSARLNKTNSELHLNIKGVFILVVPEMDYTQKIVFL